MHAQGHGPALSCSPGLCVDGGLCPGSDQRVVLAHRASRPKGDKFRGKSNPERDLIALLDSLTSNLPLQTLADVRVLWDPLIRLLLLLWPLEHPSPVTCSPHGDS